MSWLKLNRQRHGALVNSVRIVLNLSSYLIKSSIKLLKVHKEQLKDCGSIARRPNCRIVNEDFRCDGCISLLIEKYTFRFGKPKLNVSACKILVKSILL